MSMHLPGYLASYCSGVLLMHSVSSTSYPNNGRKSSLIIALESKETSC